MVNANPLGAILQNVVADPAQQIVAYGNWLYGEVNDTVRWLDHDIEVLVEEHLPKSTHQVAMSVIRSAPEIFVCTAVFSGVGVTPALLYWGTRVAKISWPFIKEILNFQFNQQAVGVAAGQALKDLFDSYKNFRPAIGMCASVAAGVSFVFGWVTGDYSLMIRSSIYGVVAQLAFTAVMLDAQASVEVREAASSLPPRERPLDKVSTEVATKPGHADSSAIEGDPSVAAASSSSSSSLTGEVRGATSSLPPRERPLDKVSTEVATRPGHADSSATEGDPSAAAASSSSSSSSNLADVNAERG